VGNEKGRCIMLKLSLSKLENARTNPVLVAQNLLETEKKNGGGQGFVSTFKLSVRNYHENDLDFKVALENLDHRLWAAFKDSPANNSRRTLYGESFTEYAQRFAALGFSIDTFQVNLNWEIISNAKLTGHSPFLCTHENYNVAYYFSEKGDDWRKQLKYPLLQIYLAEKFFKCEVEKMKIGIYNITTKEFDLHTYEDFELDNAIEEGKSVLKKVLTEYNKHIF